MFLSALMLCSTTNYVTPACILHHFWLSVCTQIRFENEKEDVSVFSNSRLNMALAIQLQYNTSSTQLRSDNMVQK